MKNGFTLVELLAVIVILAVLALIATPVVLSIIDDTKESAMLRSAEMYLSGVENAVMRENMNSGGNFRPNDCTISNGTLSCNGTTVEVEVNGEVPNSGSIKFENGKIKEVTITYETGTIVKDPSGNLVYEGIEKIEYTSLDNWKHTTNSGLISEHVDEDINGICDICGETKIPGLYKNDGTFVSWDNLLNDKYLKVTNGQLTSDTYSNGGTGTAYRFLNGELVINDDIIGIGNYAFEEVTGLKIYRIPDSVISIGNGAFMDCVVTMYYTGTATGEPWGAIRDYFVWNKE